MKRRVAGVRQAKEHLSALLRDVKEGHEWTICERGIPVARLVPAKSEPEDLQSWIARMEAEGRIKPRRGKPCPLPLPIKVEPFGIAQQYLQEDRNEERR